MLDTISKFNFPDNYIQEQQDVLRSMSLKDAKSIAQSEFNADKMYFVIAGDAKTQLSRIKELGYGNPIMLDREGNTIK